MRGAPRHFVSSKLLCWSALRRALRLARRDGLSAPRRRWEEECRSLRSAIVSQGFDAATGAFRRTFDSTAVDAALLLFCREEFVKPSDPRLLATVERVRSDLSRSGLLIRYSEADDLDGEEGAFLACSFWLADCLARQGKPDAASRIFERAAACGNDVGLFSEQIAPSTGELLGNFPQALTHLALIRAAASISAAESGE